MFNRTFSRRKLSFAHKILSSFIAVTFITSLVTPPRFTYAQTILNLPAPGTMLSTTTGYTPLLMEGLTLYPDNPLKFDFIFDRGDSKLDGAPLKEEATRLIKYFLAGLTTPESEMWVNLSPYEKDRIIPEAFGQTEMGRDLLAQDYILKQ